MRLIYLTACIILFSCAQGEIHGSFYDYETRKPIKDLKVTLLKSGGPYDFEKVTYTNEAGFYQFTDLMKDEYTVFSEGEKYLSTLMGDCDLNISLECNISSAMISNDYKPKGSYDGPGLRIPSFAEIRKYIQQELKKSNIEIPDNLSLEEFYNDLEKKLKDSNIEIPEKMDFTEFVIYAYQHLNLPTSKPAHNKSTKSNKANHAD